MDYTQLTTDKLKDWLIKYKSLSSFQNKYTVEDYYAACIEYEKRIDALYHNEILKNN